MWETRGESEDEGGWQGEREERARWAPLSPQASALQMPRALEKNLPRECGESVSDSSGTGSDSESLSRFERAR